MGTLKEMGGQVFQAVPLPPTPPNEELALHSQAELGTSPQDTRHRAGFAGALTPGDERSNGILAGEEAVSARQTSTVGLLGSTYGRAPTNHRPAFAYKSSSDVYDVKETHTHQTHEQYRAPPPRRQDDYASNTFSGFISTALSSPNLSLPIHASSDRKGSLSSPGQLVAQLPSLFTARPLSPVPTAATGSHASMPLFMLPSGETVRFIALCALWYLSSAMSSNTGKAVMTRFRFPVTLTIVQFGYVAGYCVLLLFFRERLSAERRARNVAYGQQPGWGITPATQQALRGTLIMSVFQIAGHVFSSMAIARVPVSTVHTIKALAPLFTVASYVLLFGVRYSSKTYISLFPLTLGVMLACSFDLRANASGLICALGSTLVFVSQNIFSKKLLPKDTSLATQETPGRPTSKLDKLNLLLYSSGMAFILMIPIWLYTDGGRLFGARIPGSEPKASASYLFFLFTVNGTVHFAQNLVAFSILASCSPVTYSVASLCKRIAVICIAIVSFGQHIHGVQFFGMILTFFGLWLYNQAKHDVAKGERKRGVAEKTSTLLPTAVGSSGPIFAPGSPFTAPGSLPPQPSQLISPTTPHMRVA